MKTIRLGYSIEGTAKDGRRIFLPWFQNKVEHPFDEFTPASFREWKNQNFQGIDSTGDFDHFNVIGLGRYGTNFEADLYQNYIQKDQSFYIPITWSYRAYGFQEAFTIKFSKQRLPEDLLNYIRTTHRAQVLFYSFWEGFIEEHSLEFIETFCKGNGLTKRDVLVVSSNLNPNLRSWNKPYRLYQISHFSQDLWFFNKSKAEGFEESKQLFEKYYRENNELPKEKRFLCLNRRWDNHRNFIAGYIQSQPQIRKDTWLSLGVGSKGICKRDGTFGMPTGFDVLDNVDVFRNSKHYEEVADFWRSVGKDSPNVILDTDPSDPAILENKVDLNDQLYRTAFVNLLTETHFFSRNIQFLSEKTFKSIYCLQPFILVSTAGTLEQLRRLGFRTFSNWWDESYDEIEEESPRLDKIIELVNSIAALPKKALIEMTQDMNSILLTNAYTLMSSADIDALLDYLKFEQESRTKPVLI